MANPPALAGGCSVEKDLIPFIGQIPIDKIKSPEILVLPIQR
jgi:hypothetical protein